MKVRQVSAVHIMLVSTLLLVLGVTDNAWGGVLSRLRARRCQPTCCQPTCCEAASCAPHETALHVGDCTNKMCPYTYVSEVTDPLTGNCLNRTFLCRICAGGWAYYVGSCSLTYPTSCDGICAGCLRKPMIVIPAPPPAKSGEKYEQFDVYVDEETAEKGAPVSAQVSAGPILELVQEPRRLIALQRRDERDQPVGNPIVVQLDWFVEKAPAPDRKPHALGIGHQIDNADAPPVPVEAERIAANVCVVTIETPEGVRMYVVILPPL